MAAKKQVSKKKAVAKSKSTALRSMADIEKELEAEASAESARIEITGGSYLGIKGKEFTFQNADLGDTLDVVILGFAYYNEFFDTPWRDDSPSAPACYAIADMISELEPSESAVKPQAETCQACDNNAWGSSTSGDGKACGNKRRVAVVAAADLENDMADIEIAMLKVPVKSIKNFDKYTKGVHKTVKRPIYGVVTTLSFDEDYDYEVLTFHAADKISDAALIEKIRIKRDEAHDMLYADHDPSSYVEVSPKQQRRPVQRQAAGKKTTSKKAGKNKARSRLS